MSDPSNIRYCTTSDGVRLAMRSVGRGPAVIKAANWLGNLEADSRLRSTRHWVDHITREHELTWYDARGCGLSDREAGEVSLEAWERDLEAVVEASGHHRFVLLGISQGASIAIRYAVRHPERVRALVIFGGFARGLFHQGVSERTRLAGQEMLRLAELGWSGSSRSFRQLFSARMLVDVPEEVRAEYDECYKHSVTGPMAARCLQAFYEIDARTDAAQVTCPALVMHVAGDQMILQREGALLASLIPGARWVSVPGNNHLPLVTDPGWPIIRGEIDAFLAQVGAADGQAPLPQLPPRQREVLAQVARGLTDKEIAQRLSLSPRTVEMHVAGAIERLGCRNRSEAVSRAHAWKLIS